MTEFILLIALHWGYGTSQDHIAGWKNKELCEKAGEQWKSQYNGIISRADYTCIERPLRKLGE